MQIVKVSEGMFICDVEPNRQIRLTVGEQSNRVFITEIDPEKPYDQSKWKLVLNESVEVFTGKHKGLHQAFIQFIKNTNQ